MSMQGLLRPLLLALTLTVPGPSLGAAAPTPSLIEVPVSMDLSAAFTVAEALVPRQTGGPQWHDRNGVEVRWQAWRGPLLLELRGNLLLVQAHVRYRAEARKRVIGIGLDAGCGIDEPPRQALIGVLIRLDAAPDWTLHPAFEVLPTRFIDRCEVTALGIDVSPLVERAFREQMEASLRQALTRLTPDLARLRAAAERAWQALQRPLELAPGLWLEPRPYAVAIAPPLGQARTLTTTLGVALAPQLLDQPGAAQVRPLPPLGRFQPGSGGLRLDLAVPLPLEKLSAALARGLVGRTIEVQGRQLRIADLSLGRDGERLMLTARIDGDLPGLLDVRGRPAFDATTGQLRVADLDYSFTSDHPDAELALALFYERIREQLQQAADAALQGAIDAARTQAEAKLAAGLPAGARVDLEGIRVQDLRLELGEAGVTLRGQATGAVRVVLD